MANVSLWLLVSINLNCFVCLVLMGRFLLGKQIFSQPLLHLYGGCRALIFPPVSKVFDESDGKMMLSILSKAVSAFIFRFPMDAVESLSRAGGRGFLAAWLPSLALGSSVSVKAPICCQLSLQGKDGLIGSQTTSSFSKNPPYPDCLILLVYGKS